MLKKNIDLPSSIRYYLGNAEEGGDLKSFMLANTSEVAET